MRSQLLNKINWPRSKILYYQSKIALNGNNPDLYYKLGRLFSDQERWLEAANSYQQAIKLNSPNLSGVYHFLAEVLIKLDSLEEAIVACRHAIDLNPDIFQPYFYLGEIFVRQKRWLEAIENLKKALELNPNFFWSYYHLGIALAKLEKWQEAVKALSCAVDLNPSHYDSYEQLLKSLNYLRDANNPESKIKDKIFNSSKFWSFSSNSQMQRILITGAAGQIGKSLRQYLEKSYKIRCLDIKPIPDAKDFWLVDISDFKALQKAMKSVDVVIHLAGNPSLHQPWDDVYNSSIGGTYNVFEAARQSGIPKVIYASSNHVSGWLEVEKEPIITPDMPVRPDSLYAVGKVFGEALGRFFADKYQMSIVCLRIGSFKNNAQAQNSHSRIAQTWCSPRDLAQLVELMYPLKTSG